MDLATRATRRLTTAPGVQAWPVWAMDGQSLCYLQAPSPTAELWDIYHVRLDDPDVVHRIHRKAQPGFDWRGRSPEPAKTVTPPWYGETVAGRALGQVNVANRWLALQASPGRGVRVVSKKEDTPSPALGFEPRGEETRADRFGAVELVTDEAQRPAVAVTLETEGAGSEPAMLGVSADRPYVNVQPGGTVGRLAVRVPLQFVIVPDQFANDLVLDAEGLGPNERAPLPQTPVVLGCLRGTEALVTIVAPSKEQSFTVQTGPAGEGLDAITVAPAGQAVFVALLEGEGLWRVPELVQAGDDGWSARWQRPFPAEWRMAVRGGTAGWSRMWNVEDFDNLGGDPLPIDTAFSQAPEAVVVYAWGRDRNTSFDVLLPTDVVWDVLGVVAGQTALDVAGVRGYRVAARRVALPELAAHGPAWTPWRSRRGSPEFGVLEVMAGAFAARTEGTRSFVTHLGEDAIALLLGLDDRIGEYMAFSEEVTALCTKHRGADRGGFLASTREDVDASAARGRTAPRTDVAALEASLDRLVGILGSKPGPFGTADILSDSAEYQEFARQCRALEAERRGIVAEFRSLAKRVQDRAAWAIVRREIRKPLGDKLRAMTMAILRNRYYIEDDWRGEAPLPGGTLE